MEFIEKNIKGVYEILLSVKGDERGWLARTYCANVFKEKAGINDFFVQANHTFTLEKGTIRGLHYQIEPHSELKLIRCIRGKVFDVAVDLREKSPTFLHYISIELSPENNNMFLIPKGCAHGFQTLTSDCEMLYLHSAFYSPEFERGCRYDDPKINIQFPLIPTVISQRDQQHPFLT